MGVMCHEVMDIQNYMSLIKAAGENSFAVEGAGVVNVLRYSPAREILTLQAPS